MITTLLTITLLILFTISILHILKYDNFHLSIIILLFILSILLMIVNQIIFAFIVLFKVNSVWYSEGRYNLLFNQIPVK